ncbi:MAG TPA: hypothetical protein VD971_08215 [Phycisphaerales bacterium]|nr:hypothetical protein [Phycisphaerales bacterium]
MNSMHGVLQRLEKLRQQKELERQTRRRHHRWLMGVICRSIVGPGSDYRRVERCDCDSDETCRGIQYTLAVADGNWERAGRLGRVDLLPRRKNESMTDDARRSFNEEGRQVARTAAALARARERLGLPPAPEEDD